ncbi:MAG: Zn-ribbon domain-containing OB-fold protein [Alphaproteobacteria bacterium]
MVPEPIPSDLTRPFWDAAARHVLVRPRCSSCGASFFTPQIACPNCLSEQWTWEPSTGQGVVYSASVVSKPPDPGIQVPYVLAIVTLSEGWRMLTNIVNCRPEDVRIGMAVRVNWQRKLGSVVVPTFEPAAGPGAP